MRVPPGGPRPTLPSATVGPENGPKASANRPAPPGSLALPETAAELPRWFEGKKTIEDVTLHMSELPKLLRLLKDVPQVAGRKLVPAVVMDLDKTLRDGNLTPELAKALFSKASPVVQATELGIEAGRGPINAARLGASGYWLDTALKRLLTGLASAATPLPFVGRTEAEVEALTHALLDRTGEAGIFDGVRPALAAMKSAGLEPFIVTAGLEAPARAVAERLGVPKDHVRGTRPLELNGFFMPVPELPTPVLGGKSVAISRLFEEAGWPRNADPVLVMGDNPTITDTGLMKRGWVDAIIDPDARGTKYIEDSLARGNMAFAVNVKPRGDRSTGQTY